MKAIDSYPVKFRRKGEPLTEADIAACSAKLDLTLPQSYTEFLLNHNGGSPSPAYLPYPGSGTKVRRFLSVADGDLVATYQRQRNENGLPKHFVSIAELDDSESFLVLDCSQENQGGLLSWFELEEGFGHSDQEYNNAVDLYFSIDQLLSKFGPAKNREDRDGMFCRLYFSSSDPRRGPQLASAFVDAGYDINFVLPTFRHPIFGSIDSEAFGVTVAFLQLGTSLEHMDPLHENARIGDRLDNALTHWNGLLDSTKENNYEPGQKMAKRNIANIESAIAALEHAT